MISRASTRVVSVLSTVLVLSAFCYRSKDSIVSRSSCFLVFLDAHATNILSRAARTFSMDIPMFATTARTSASAITPVG